MDEVTTEIKNQLLQKKKHDLEINMKTQIMDQLLKSHSFAVPESMVKRQLKVLLERAESDLLKKGVNEKAIEENRERLSGKLHNEAENKVKLYFVLDAIAEAEKIEVSDEDVEIWIRSLASSYGKPFKEVMEYY
jgi:trigger factor